MYGRWIEDVDLVLRFETFQADFDTMLKRLDIQPIEIPLVNRTGERRARHYREFYDTRTRRYVEQLYALDLERFGYSF